MDGVQVGAEAAQQAQQHQCEQEEEEGHRHGGVGDDLQREDVAMLQGVGTLSEGEMGGGCVSGHRLEATTVPLSWRRP